MGIAPSQAQSRPQLARVTLGSFLALLAIGGGTNYSLPVYLQHLTADRGMPLDLVSGGTSVVFLVGSLAGFGVAKYLTTRDPRPVILVAGLVGGVSIAAIGQVTEVWQAYLAYAGMGISFIAFGVGPVMLSVLRHAEPTSRARALALSTVGVSLGGVVLSPLAVLTIDQLGFSWATVLLGALVAVTVPAVVLWIMPPSPPSDPMPSGAPAPDEPAIDHLDVVHDVPYGRAVRSPAMWLTVAAVSLFFSAQIGGIAHVVRLSAERGLAVAGLVVSIITGSAVVSRLFGSWILARVALWRWVLAVAVLQTLALTVFAVAHASAVMVAGALVLGIVVGSAPIISPLMVVETFGMLDYPRIQAMQQIVASVGQGLGPVVISVTYAWFGGYLAGYLAAAVLSAAGCLLAGLAARAASRVPRTLRELGSR